MLRTFNCGVGLVLVVGKNDSEAVLASMPNEKARILGHVETCSDGKYFKYYCIKVLVGM